MILLNRLRRTAGELFDHAVNAGVLALVVGREQGLDTAALEHLWLGAILHDIGHTRLPQNLVRKSGRYSVQEEKLLRLHPELGAGIVSQAHQLDEVCRRIVVEHHELLDGSGYPKGLPGTRISPLSQIVGLVDRYDALTGGRGGRAAMFPAQAVRELSQLGISRRYDPELVELMIGCLGVYPVGSLVELTTGERGVVIAQNPGERLKPTLTLIWEAPGRPYPIPWIVDLAAGSAEGKGSSRSIRRVLDPALEQVNLAACIEDIAATIEGTARQGAGGLP
jgi:HD-GYP domain-containing protein (c-di-GMP phosphodiesterase class II)